MIWVAKRVLLVKEIEEAGDGFGESSDQKSAAFYVAALFKKSARCGGGTPGRQRWEKHEANLMVKII